jgi:hypothetical protein
MSFGNFDGSVFCRGVSRLGRKPEPSADRRKIAVPAGASCLIVEIDSVLTIRPVEYVVGITRRFGRNRYALWLR